MPAPATFAMTLKDLETHLLADETLPVQARRDMISALRRFANICGRTPADVIADPAVIRSLMAAAPWQLAGYSKASWANMRSLITRAMSLAGIKVHRQRRNYCLAPQWNALLAPLNRRDRDELHRFAGWASVLGIIPGAVGPPTFDLFLQYMEEQSVQRGPRERAHVARRAWNRAVANDGSSYPHVPAPPLRAKLAMRWTDFPAALQAHVASWGERATAIHALDGEHRPIKSVTLRNYSVRLRVMLSAAVASGVAPDSLVSLREVIEPGLVKRALTHALGGRKLDDQARQNLHGMVVAALNVGRFLGIDDAHRAALLKLEKQVRYVARGMNAKNKERLFQLENPAVRARLLKLPVKVAADMAKVKVPSVRDAQQMQMAVLLDILLHLPLRIRNAAELDLAATIAPPAAGLAGKWRISIPADEVKNEVAIDGQLGLVTSGLIQQYVSAFRPVLAKNGTTCLFPGQTGNPKVPSALSRQLSRFIKRETGIVFNAHLFRHLAALLYLTAYPGDYETVRRLLGHKNLETAIRSYCGAETAASLSRYDAMIDGMRESASSSPASRGRYSA